MLTMVHANPALLRDGFLTVDRKFLSGIHNYANQINAPLNTIHPELLPGTQIMDPVTVPVSELNFSVVTFPRNLSQRETDLLITEQIAKSKLVYGSGFGSTRIARRLGVPYVLMQEYDLKTKITMSTAQVPNILKQIKRMVWCLKHHVFHEIPTMRAAHSVHCNGYPVYEESRPFIKNRLLYLDSRMPQSMVIAEDVLNNRFKSRANRPIRLLYSGRYERVKGSEDAVRVAVECLRRGLNIELHTYGQGSLLDSMTQLARQSPVPNRIFIHNAIPYPELVERTREFDIFVCCHIQNDPSCTYLESFGAGLPVVGYDNKMWRGLCRESGVGFSTPMHSIEAIVLALEKLLNNDSLLQDMSLRARDFALAHSFEKESTLRIDALNMALSS